MKVFNGGAWPYAKESLHIDRIAALLPGGVLARYYRLKGYKVCYVTGSDCHGTPIQIRANKEGVRLNKSLTDIIRSSRNVLINSDFLMTYITRPMIPTTFVLCKSSSKASWKVDIFIQNP